MSIILKFAFESNSLLEGKYVGDLASKLCLFLTQVWLMIAIEVGKYNANFNEVCFFDKIES